MPEPVSTIAAAIGIIDAALKTAAVLRKKLASGKASREELTGAIKAFEADFLTAKEEIFDLREELSKSENDNLALRKQILDHESKVRAEDGRAIEGPRYEKVKVGQSWVVVEEGTKEPHYCPTCHAQGKAIVIQPAPSAMRVMGTHDCATCNTWFNLR